jgi:hypothetical protein
MMTTKLTTAQRRLLTAARDHGTPWGYPHPTIPGATMTHPWRSSTDAAISRLVDLGLLHGWNQPGARGTITPAGREALA